MKKVLFVAGMSEDYYFKPFVAACKRKDIEVYLLDATLFPRSATLSIQLNDDGCVVGEIDVLRCERDSYEKTRLNIRDVQVAWAIRTPRLKQETESLEDRFARNESMGAIRSFLSILPCRWVNREEQIELLSSNKLYQQYIARKCGLRVPRTLISNDPTCVVAFSDPKNGLLLKSIGCIKLDNAGRKFIYSERFSHQELKSNPTAIKNCPIFSQEYVCKKYEYRVMAIGKQVLACKIDSQASEKTKIDWRHYDLKHVAHTQAELPRGTQEKILHFMQEVQLQYGAIDLIETPSGDFVFLEINPNGQWGWIADLAHLPIPQAVAEMLAEA